MEVKEAADLLDNLIGMIEDSGGRDYDTALKMGIEALTSKPTDCISRQAAVDALKAHEDYKGYLHGDFETILEALPSAQSEPQWIPCERELPEDLEEVNVTWVNHKPEPYYDFVKDKPFTASAVYYKGKWFWYTSTCADLLAEYGKNPNHEIDDAIEITAWMPLPEPYKERREE